MNRRSMLALGTRALVAYPVLARTGCSMRSQVRRPASRFPAGVLRRIGITTVCFRDRFTRRREGRRAMPAGKS